MDDIERQLRDLGERTAAEPVRYDASRKRIVRRARVRRGLNVAGSAVAVAVLAAVVVPRLDAATSEGGRPDRVTELATVAATTEEAGTARMEIETAADFGERASTTVLSGVADFTNDRYHLRAQPSLGDRFEVISIGGTLYQRGAGSKWFATKVPASDISNAYGPDASQLFSYLRSVSDDVTRVGEEGLDGVRTTHYRVESDPTEPVAVEIEVWIDDAGRLRQLVHGSSTDGLGSVRMTVRLWDFGIPVDIAAPPRDEITDERPMWAPSAPDESVTAREGALGMWVVAGDEGRREAHLIVTAGGDGHFSNVCVRGLPFPARVSIRDEESGRALHTFPRGNVPTIDPTESCTQTVTVAKRIVDDPERFTLRLHGENGWGDVPLTTSDPLLE